MPDSTQPESTPRSGLPQLVLGGVIALVSALLVARDVFDLVSDPDAKTANWHIVASLNVLVLVAGLLIAWRRPKIADLATLAFSVLVVFGGLEAALRSGFFDGVDDPAPVWIPRKYHAANEAIEAPHERRSELHPHGFNDVVPEREKAPGTRRVVVLGDSFIWGSGVDEEKRWSRQLEELLQARDPRIEVYHWGKRGWSTRQELDFLLTAGFEYEMDLLLVGWVSNDPDLDDTPHLYLTWQRGRRFSPISRVFPNAWDFLTAYTNRFLMQYFLPDYGYDSWKNRLYEDANLERYGAVLEELAAAAEERGVPVLVVMTPNTYLPSYREKFDRVIPLLEAAGLDHLDLFPAVEREFGHTNLRHLWANPADGHPSPEVNAVYAREVVQALEARGELFGPEEPEKQEEQEVGEADAAGADDA